MTGGCRAFGGDVVMRFVPTTLAWAGVLDRGRARLMRRLLRSCSTLRIHPPVSADRWSRFAEAHAQKYAVPRLLLPLPDFSGAPPDKLIAPGWRRLSWRGELSRGRQRPKAPRVAANADDPMLAMFPRGNLALPVGKHAAIRRSPLALPHMGLAHVIPSPEQRLAETLQTSRAQPRSGHDAGDGGFYQRSPLRRSLFTPVALQPARARSIRRDRSANAERPVRGLGGAPGQQDRVIRRRLIDHHVTATLSRVIGMPVSVPIYANQAAESARRCARFCGCDRLSKRALRSAQCGRLGAAGSRADPCQPSPVPTPRPAAS